MGQESVKDPKSLDKIPLQGQQRPATQILVTLAYPACDSSREAIAPECLVLKI